MTGDLHDQGWTRGDLHDLGWTLAWYLFVIAASFALGVMCAGPIDHLIDSCPQPSSTATGAVIYQSEEKC